MHLQGRTSTEAELLGRALQGDADSLSTLLKWHGPVVRTAIAGRIPPELRAVLSEDDVMQETYAEVFLAINNFEPNGNGAFGAWLRRIAQNILLDAVRHLTAVKRGGRSRRRGVRSGEGLSRLTDLICTDGTTPSEGARRRELGGHLRRALEQLPDTYREVVRLYDLKLLSVDETARRLGCSPGAMFMRRSRAHRMLRTILERFSDYL